MVIPNPLEIATNLACPQTPNTGGFETSSGSAPPLLGATALGGFPDLKQVAWAGGRFGKIHIIDFGIWYYVGMKDQESHAALATQLSTASNPETAPEILRELSQHELIEVRQAVAMNPNTPIDILWELVEEFSHEVVANPVFSLVTLENPNWIYDIPDQRLAAMLQQPNPSQVIVSEALEYDDSFSEYYIQTLAVNQVVQRLNISIEVLEEIVLKHKTLYSSIVGHPKVQIDSFKKFAESDDWGIQLDLISFCLDDNNEEVGVVWPHHPHRKNIAEAIIPLLIDKAVDDGVKIAFLNKVNLPPEFMSTLIKNLPYNSLLRLAKSKETPSNVLMGLTDFPIEDTNWQIRILQAVAKNTQTPLPTVEKLTSSQYEAVRAHIANRSDLLPEILVKLLNDPYPKVRKNLFGNPHIATTILIELSTHPEPKIREFAQIYRSQHP
jgi:hypothetical protein